MSYEGWANWDTWECYLVLSHDANNLAKSTRICHDRKAFAEWLADYVRQANWDYRDSICWNDVDIDAIISALKVTLLNKDMRLRPWEIGHGYHYIRTGRDTDSLRNWFDFHAPPNVLAEAKEFARAYDFDKLRALIVKHTVLNPRYIHIRVIADILADR